MESAERVVDCPGWQEVSPVAVCRTAIVSWKVVVAAASVHFEEELSGLSGSSPRKMSAYSAANARNRGREVLNQKTRRQGGRTGGKVRKKGGRETSQDSYRRPSISARQGGCVE